jgi:hypothetical protein
LTDLEWLMLIISFGSVCGLWILFILHLFAHHDEDEQQ